MLISAHHKQVRTNVLNVFNCTKNPFVWILKSCKPTPKNLVTLLLKLCPVYLLLLKIYIMKDIGFIGSYLNNYISNPFSYQLFSIPD